MTARIRLTFAATLLAGLGLQAAAAHAGTVRFCNETDTTIQISIGYREDGAPFTTRGWWAAAPGQCSGYIARGSKGRYYVHIAKAGGEPLSLRTTGRTVLLCISGDKFEDRFHEHVKDEKLDCASAGLTMQKFLRVEAQPDSQDVFALQADGTLKVATVAAPQPRSPVQAQPKVPVPSEKIAAPEPNKRIAAPAPQVTPRQTPNACQRFPNLC